MYPPILSHCQQNLFAQPDSELSWELIAVRLLASHCEHHPWESGQFRDSQKPVSCGPNKITLYCPHETKLDVLGVVVWKVHSFCLTSDRNGQRHKARNIATPQTDQDSKMTNAFPASSTWWNQTRAYFRKISRKISLNLKAMESAVAFFGNKNSVTYPVPQSAGVHFLLWYVESLWRHFEIIDEGEELSYKIPRWRSKSIQLSTLGSNKILFCWMILVQVYWRVPAVLTQISCQESTRSEDSQDENHEFYMDVKSRTSSATWQTLTTSNHQAAPHCRCQLRHWQHLFARIMESPSRVDTRAIHLQWDQQRHGAFYNKHAAMLAS